jgi:hypothetical protein
LDIFLFSDFGFLIVEFGFTSRLFPCSLFLLFIPCFVYLLSRSISNSMSGIFEKRDQKR